MAVYINLHPVMSSVNVTPENYVRDVQHANCSSDPDPEALVTHQLQATRLLEVLTQESEIHAEVASAARSLHACASREQCAFFRQDDEVEDALRSCEQLLGRQAAGDPEDARYSWDQLLLHTGKLLRLEEGLEEDLQLLSFGGNVAIDMGKWRGEVSIVAHPTLRLALLLLRRNGLLNKKEEPEHVIVKQEEDESRGSQHQCGSQEQQEVPEEHMQEQMAQTLEQEELNKVHVKQEQVEEESHELSGVSKRLVLNVKSISFHTVLPERESKKRAPLLALPAVHVLQEVLCDQNRKLALLLLRRHMNSLQELQLCAADREHLMLLSRMPHLQRLELDGCHPSLQKKPVLPQVWATRELRWMRLKGVPLITMSTLLRAHQHTLERLELAEECTAKVVDLLRSVSSRAFGRFQLQRLRALGVVCCCPNSCAALLDSLRAFLPDCLVSCLRC